MYGLQVFEADWLESEYCISLSWFIIGCRICGMLFLLVLFLDWLNMGVGWSGLKC